MTLNTNDFAQSEEYAILCDVKGCQASLCMVSGISRSQHDWGRVSVYPEGLGTVKDFDLCAPHFRNVMNVLEGK